jgi:hypothetical protein
MAVYGVFFVGVINLAFAVARFLTIQLGTDQYFNTFSLVGTLTVIFFFSSA